MKTLILIFSITILSIASKAQTLDPNMAFGQIPPINPVCGLSVEEKDKYKEQISEAAQIVRDDLYERKMARDAKEKDYQKQGEANAAAKYGFSSSDMQKMKDDNLSEAEKKALIDKALQNSAGISMAEVENLKEMDKESREAWAEGYSTQKMAEQSADPEKAKKEQMDNMNAFNLVNAQQKLNDSLNACMSKYMKQFQEIDEDENCISMRREIDSIRAELNSKIGADYHQESEIEALANKLRSKCEAYCSKFTSRYIDVLVQYKQFVGASIPDYNRLQELTLAMNQKQFGIKMEEKPGTFALESVSGFYGKLQGIDKYYLMTPYFLIVGHEN